MAKCLVVEDQPQDLYLLKSILEGNGFEVETAVNGQEALEKAHKNPPNLIISDILMPVMDGFSLCRAWMQDEQLLAIPFIFYTATYTDNKDETLAYSLGAARFITKPMEPDKLMLILNEIANDFSNGRFVSNTVQTEDESSFLKKHNERLIQRLEQKMLMLEDANQHLKALYWASSHLVIVRPIRELVTHALNVVLKTLHYASANYFHYDEASYEFRLLAAVDANELSENAFVDLQRHLLFRLGEERGLVGLVGKNRQALILPDPLEDSRWIPLDKTIRSALFIPVLYEDQLLGVASFFGKNPNMFTDNHVRDATTLINNLAVAIENARLYSAQKNYANQLERQVAERTAELVDALERAQAADGIKSQFVSDINHELRTPLSNIKLYLGLLDQGRPENRERYKSILHRETDRLQLLMEELLDLSQLDQDKTMLHLTKIDLNHLIGKLIADRGQMATEKSLTLDFEAESNFPVVMADSQLLFQVAANLLANAINYTPSGGAITVRTETAVVENKAWATISINDTGPGISAAEKDYLFQRFFRGEAGRNSGVPGTGLGLAICHEIINRHKGSITIESTIGQGSTFTVWLPLSNP
jgi:signal transduction histidine kinase/ActR/RegA family two-component response regulator